MADPSRKHTAGRRDLLKALARKGWSQQDLCRKLGVEPGIVSRWVTGDRTPSLESAIELERVLGIKPKRWIQIVPPDEDNAGATGTDGH